MLPGGMLSELREAAEVRRELGEKWGEKENYGGESGVKSGEERAGSEN